MDLSLLAYPAVLLFLLGCWAERGANPRSSQRHLLLLFPFVALVLGFLALFLFDEVDLLVQWLWDMASGAFPFLPAIDFTYLAALVFNVLFLLYIAGIKAAYLGLARSFPQAVSAVMDFFGRIFYRQSEERDGWYLKSSLRGVRRMLKFACVASVVVSAVLIWLAYSFSEITLLSAFVSPVLATVLVSEVYYAVSGITEPEYEDEVGVEEDDAQRVYDYTGLVDALEHYFGDRLLHLASRGKVSGRGLAHDDFCHRLLNSPNYEEQLAGEYCQALVGKGILKRVGEEGGYGDLNHDMAQAMVRLLKGESVLVATSFFRDYVPYVFFPVVRRLMRNDRVLVLAGPRVGAHSLQEFLSEGLDFVSGDARLWSVEWVGHGRESERRAQGIDAQTLSAESPREEYPDVGILSFADLLDARAIHSLDGFLEEVTLTLVLDSSGLLSTYQIGLSHLAEHLTHGKPACYCIFDRNHDGLVDALSQTLRTPFTEVVATEFADASSVGLFWQVDGSQLQHRLVTGVAHNLGFGTELALVGLKEGVHQVTWASGSTVPLLDQRWIDGQYYSDLMEFAGLPVEQRQLDESIEFEDDVWAIPKRGHRFIVCEDESHNLFETYRQYATRASEQAFVNVVAPNYLFRDYMVANASVFSADPKAIPAFAPDFSNSPRNAAHGILMLMTASPDGSVPEEEIVRRLRFMGIECDDCKATVGRLIEDYVDVDDAHLSDLPEERLREIPYEAYDEESKRMVARQRLALQVPEAYERVFQQLRVIPIATEMPDGTMEVLGSHLFCHAYQSYLPGQYVTIRGKYYEVDAVSPTKGVVLRRAADHFDRRHYYRPLTTVAMGSMSACNGVGDVRSIASIRILRCVGDFSVRTRGYLDLQDYGDLESGPLVLLEGIPEREYRSKSILRLEFDGASQAQVRALAVVLSEALVTLFPNDHAYLKVVVPETGMPTCIGLDGYDAPLPRYEGEDEPGVIYVLEDSVLDIGLLASFDRNVNRILSIAWDYLDWVESRISGEAPGSVGGDAPMPEEVEGEVVLEPEGDANLSEDAASGDVESEATPKGDPVGSGVGPGHGASEADEPAGEGNGEVETAKGPDEVGEEG